MVKEYKKPEFKTVVFEAEDVITTSNGTETPAPPAGEELIPSQDLFDGTIRLINIVVHTARGYDNITKHYRKATSMVKAYKKPEFKTVVFETEDVITTSGAETPEPLETTPMPTQVTQLVGTISLINVVVYIARVL